MAEHLPWVQEVEGSIPFVPTRTVMWMRRINVVGYAGRIGEPLSRFGVHTVSVPRNAGSQTGSGFLRREARKVFCDNRSLTEGIPQRINSTHGDIHAFRSRTPVAVAGEGEG